MSWSDMQRHHLAAFPRGWAPPMYKVNTSEVLAVISTEIVGTCMYIIVKSVSLHRC